VGAISICCQFQARLLIFVAGHRFLPRSLIFTKLKTTLTAMKNYLVAGLCAISLSFSPPLFSQCLWRETVINFDKEEENKKNFLGVISYKDSEYTDLVFIKKKPKDEVVYETIRLDKELYTVEKFEEADKDFGKDVFKGISYVTTIPTVATEVLGFNVVLESYEFRFHWNWATGDYSSASPIQKKKDQGKNTLLCR